MFTEVLSTPTEIQLAQGLSDSSKLLSLSSRAVYNASAVELAEVHNATYQETL